MTYAPSTLGAARLARAALATIVAPLFAGPIGLAVATGGDIGGSVAGTDVSLLSAATFYGYLAALVPLAIAGVLMLALATHYPRLWAKGYWALAGAFTGLVLTIALEPYLLLVPALAGGAVSALVYRLIVGRPRPRREAVQAHD